MPVVVVELLEAGRGRRTRRPRSRRRRRCTSRITVLVRADEPRHEAAVRRLLAEVDGALPAPVGEDAEQQRRDQRVAVVDRERVEPRPRRVDRRRDLRRRPDLGERDDREEEERRDLGDDHHVLHSRRELGPEDADHGHDDDVGDREQRHRGLRAGGAVRAERAGTCSARRRRRGSRSRGFPSRRPPSRRSSPRTGPSVRVTQENVVPASAVGAVHVEERARDQEHRHERRSSDAGAWTPTTTTSEPMIAASV